MALTANDAQDVYVGNCYIAVGPSGSATIMGVTQEGSVFHFAGKFYERKVHEFGETILSRKVLGVEAYIDVTFKAFTSTVLTLLRASYFSSTVAVVGKVGQTMANPIVTLYPQANESAFLLRFHAANIEPQWDFDMKNDADGILKTRIHATPHTSDGAIFTMGA